MTAATWVNWDSGHPMAALSLIYVPLISEPQAGNT